MLIYSLYSSRNTDKVYVGSTKSKYLSMRKAQHKYSFKNYLCGKTSYCSSALIVQLCRKSDDLQIELLEEVSDETREAEEWWIKHLKSQGFDVVNSNRAVFSKEQTLDDLKQKYKDDKENGIMPRALKYYYENKAEILKKRKIYYQENIKLH